MKLEDQVCNLELSRRLKELGVKQDAFYSWYEATDRDDDERLNRTDENCPTCNLPKQPFEEKIAAFTVAELGEMLGDWQFGVRNYGATCTLWAQEPGQENRGIPMMTETTEADARAKMLIYLIEQGLVKVGEMK